MKLSWRPRHPVLGLAIEEHAIHVAQVRAESLGVPGPDSGKARAATMTFPETLSWKDPAAVGVALGAFLREQGFNAHHAIVGLPGRWLLFRPVATPPAQPAAAIGLLRLAIERDLPVDARQWSFDYAGEPNPVAKTTLLLAATANHRLDAVTAALPRAGLQVQALTATPLLLVASVPDVPGDPGAGRAVLMLSNEGAELAIVRGGEVLMIERLGTVPGPGAGPSLASEIRRVLMVASSKNAMDPAALVVWNSSTFAEWAIEALAEDLALPLARPGRAGEKTHTAAAELLAHAAARDHRPPVDFLRSRLAVAPPRRFSTRQRLAAAAVLLVLVLSISFAFEWYALRESVRELDEQLTAMNADLAEAQHHVDRLRMGRGWFDQRPSFLECLRGVTLAFPESGQVWTTSLALRDDMSGTLAGKAVDEKAVLDLLNQLKSSGRFGDVKLLYLRQDSRESRGASFALTFVFLGSEPGR